MAIFAKKMLMYYKFSSKLRNFNCLLFMLFIGLSIHAQTIQQEKMKKLSFMVGEWVGTSTSFKNDSIVKQVAAFEKVTYKLAKNIITIDLNSESLQLHTVIYYDTEAATYYYTPYYKSGSKRYEGEYKDGKFLVWFNPEKRLTFTLTSEGHFQEYGETLVDGVWHKYFEDILKKGG